MCFECFCVFAQRSQVTAPMCFVCFCVFFINVQFDPTSDRDNHPMCFMCFCVSPQRSQVTPPMCSVCFCILSTTFSWNLVQTGATTPCVFCVFVFFFPTDSRSQDNTHVFYVFLCFFFHRSQVTPPMCFVCFCVFFTNVQFDPSSDRCNHPMCFVCFLNKYVCPTQIPEILDQQNIAQLISKLNEVKRRPVDCANNVVRAEGRD